MWRIIPHDPTAKYLDRLQPKEDSGQTTLSGHPLGLASTTLPDAATQPNVIMAMQLGEPVDSHHAKEAPNLTMGPTTTTPLPDVTIQPNLITVDKGSKDYFNSPQPRRQIRVVSFGRFPAAGEVDYKSYHTSNYRTG